MFRTGATTFYVPCLESGPPTPLKHRVQNWCHNSLRAVFRIRATPLKHRAQNRCHNSQRTEFRIRATPLKHRVQNWCHNSLRTVFKIRATPLKHRAQNRCHNSQRTVFRIRATPRRTLSLAPRMVIVRSGSLGVSSVKVCTRTVAPESVMMSRTVWPVRVRV